MSDADIVGNVRQNCDSDCIKILFSILIKF